jgi:hypothetical protein
MSTVRTNSGSGPGIRGPAAGSSTILPAVDRPVTKSISLNAGSTTSLATYFPRTKTRFCALHRITNFTYLDSARSTNMGRILHHRYHNPGRLVRGGYPADCTHPNCALVAKSCRSVGKAIKKGVFSIPSTDGSITLRANNWTPSRTTCSHRGATRPNCFTAGNCEHVKTSQNKRGRSRPPSLLDRMENHNWRLRRPSNDCFMQCRPTTVGSIWISIHDGHILYRSVLRKQPLCSLSLPCASGNIAGRDGKKQRPGIRHPFVGEQDGVVEPKSKTTDDNAENPNEDII